MKFWLVVILITLIVINIREKRKNRQKVEELSLPNRNIPIQYALTIDNWYECRRSFDKLIEADWQLYKNGEITDQIYRERCKVAVKKIIPAEYQPGFQTLYEWGARQAAVQIARMGLMPGISEYAHLNNKNVREFNPTCYNRKAYNGPSSWMKCIPGTHCFLDLYPNPKYLEYMGCGVVVNDVWQPIMRPEDYAGIYYNTATFMNIDADRRRAIDFFSSRGYNGHSYAGDKRGFGDLTKDEIKMKYQFIINEPYYSFVDNSAQCELVRDPNRVLEEVMQEAEDLRRQAREGREKLKELTKNGQ